MKKIYVTGSGGLIGSRFLELLPKKYITLIPEIDELDITDKKALKKFILEEKPDVIVHFAAYTNVSEAENQKGDKNALCWKINVEGTKNLVNLINPKKAHFIHISTDHVFSGRGNRKGPYSERQKAETDSKKLTWYGYTKAEAERIVIDKLGKNVTIVRMIYPVRAKYDGKSDYLRKPLELFDQGKLYPMFSNQQVSITFIDEASKALKKIIEGNLKGIYHASSKDTGTPFKLVSYLIKKARGKEGVVKSQTLEEFIKNTNSNPVRYPKYGGLKVERTEKELRMKFGTWRQIINKLVKQGI